VGIGKRVRGGRRGWEMRGGIGVARGCFGVKNPLERKFFSVIQVQRVNLTVMPCEFNLNSHGITV
jgi:hypothetical protein